MPDGTFYVSQDADVVPGEHSDDYFALGDAERRSIGVPRVDTHVYARENGWAIQALCALHAYGVLDDRAALDEAVTAARWIIAHRSRPGGGFRHEEGDDTPYLGDNLAMGEAFLALYGVSADREWLRRAADAAGFVSATSRNVRDGGKALGYVAGEVQQFAENAEGDARLKVDREYLAKGLEDAQAILGAVFNDLMSANPADENGDIKNIYKVGLNTTRLVYVLGDVLVAWLLLRGAEVALAALDAGATGADKDFYEGKGQAIGALAGEYPVDTRAIANLLSEFGTGNVVDLACGTGFWLTAYGRKCTSVTLVDQSGAALARCQQRVEQLGLQEKARLVQADIFEVALREAAYDACVLEFLLSHLPDLQVTDLFGRLRTILHPGAALAVVDGAWSAARKPYRHRDGFERRALADGRSFVIRKRYFDRTDLETLLEREGFPVRSTYVGNVFIAAVGRRAV